MPSIVFLILLVLFVVAFVVIMVATKNFISKANILYVIPIGLIVWGLYVKGYMYQFGSFDLIAGYQTLASTIWAFMFRVERQYVEVLMAEDRVYSICVNLGIALCGITAWSSVLAFVKVALVNMIHVFIRLHRHPVDLVYGYDDDAVEYCKNTKCAILWIDPRKRKLTAEDKKSLYLDGVYIIYKPYSGKALTRQLRFVTGIVQVLVLQKKSELMPMLFESLDTVKTHQGLEIVFKVQTEQERLSYVNEQLSLHARGNEGAAIAASSFDYHEIIGRDFSYSHNIALYLPKDFVQDGALLPNKEIRVMIFGFGRTGKAIYRSLLLNNQFVEIVDGHYRAKKIHFSLFDSRPEAFQTPDLSHLLHFDMLRQKATRSALPPMELTADVKTHVLNVAAEVSPDLLSAISGDENTFTFYVLALDDAMTNSMLAERLATLVDQSRAVILYCVDHHSERLLGNYPCCIPYGFKDEILSHAFLTNESLFRLAKSQNEAYNLSSGTKSSFYALPIIEKMSNVYSEINLRFKMNLLGFDIAESGERVSEEEFQAAYDPEGKAQAPIVYEEYKALSTRNALIYQEHLRWCVFYFLNGYRSMDLSEIGFQGKPIHKDPLNRKHACLTSFEGLDRVHRFEAKLYQEHGIEKTLLDVETYKYDASILDNAYDALNKEGLVLIRRDK